MKQKKQSGFAHLVVITIILAVGLIGALGYIYWHNFVQSKGSSNDTTVKTKTPSDNSKPTAATTTTTLTNEQIFNEVSSQLGLVRSDVLSFKIYGQDKIKYALVSANTDANGGSVVAYKIDSKWNKVSVGTGIGSCTAFADIPVKYRPGCVENNEVINAENYPESQAVTYIGE